MHPTTNHRRRANVLNSLEMNLKVMEFKPLVAVSDVGLVGEYT
jgi:hypothetical protein